jgi:hypothetical protein
MYGSGGGGDWKRIAGRRDEVPGEQVLPSIELRRHATRMRTKSKRLGPTGWTSTCFTGRRTSYRRDHARQEKLIDTGQILLAA